jgi:hypothetical protein
MDYATLPLQIYNSSHDICKYFVNIDIKINTSQKN